MTTEGQPGRPDPARQREEDVPETLEGFGVNAALVDEIRQRFEVDPSSVHPSWAELFDPKGRRRDEAPRPAVPAAPAGEPPQADAHAEAEGPLAPRLAEKHARVLRLIHSYRARGHRIADTDPLGGRSTYFPELDPAHYGFGHEDLDQPWIAGDLPGGPVQTLRQILDRLRATYCGPVGVEFTHVQDPGRKTWLQRHMEESENTSPFSTSARLHILEKLSSASLFERFLHTKFLGQKRFSLEGAESVIPLLDTIVEEAPNHGIRELVLGMAHRGRLNVLSNILGKSLESIFSEFEDMELLSSPFGSGDVKYHRGFSSDRRTAAGPRVHLSLTSNPSHLEAVDPVVQGRCRAKQLQAGDERGQSIIPVLLHGDAAFAGQGIVAETLNLCHLEGYSTGGTLHVVVNNQIGFTTTPSEARSTLYCTDVAKMIQIPIFHVNGDDPDAVVHCVLLALAYRQRFGDDVVIDMVCYRRYGHNEADEPGFTQPLLYEKIRRMIPVRVAYTEKLIRLGILREDDARRIEQDLSNQLQQALQVIKTQPPGPDEPYEPRGPWTGYQRRWDGEEPETAVPVERLAQIAEGIGTLPPEVGIHPKLQALLEKRRKVVAAGEPIDWAMGEALAFGSLVVEGSNVRLSGQDSSRGTFSHRHAVVVDQRSGTEYVPLSHLSETQGRFDVYDSLLSEAAVLGFEYGYSLADPSTLTLWEAQFGDFANGAQVIIDQFITSASVKWQRMSGLVMLLPHGYEGQGPEHSSARPERFLQLCAEDNIQVANCSNSAQYFHLLRRQTRRRYRAPLVIFTPKSLLRSPKVMSPVEAFSDGRFQKVLDDVRAAERPDRVRRVLLCTGKVYHDLIERRQELEKGPSADTPEVAIVRVELLYPWPAVELREVVQQYARASKVFWVQEEPANQGAWTFVESRVRDALLPHQVLGYAGRPEAAAPAGGSLRIHRDRQAALIEAAFAGLDE